MGNKVIGNLFKNRTTRIKVNGTMLEVRKLTFREAQDFDALVKENAELMSSKEGESSNDALEKQVGFMARILHDLVPALSDADMDELAESLMDTPVADLNDLVEKVIEAATGNKNPTKTG